MRFLADESCDFIVVRALRGAGYDVVAVSEMSPRAEDTDVIRLALTGERILLTEDKDFGRLVYAHGQSTLGVILVRFPTRLRGLLPDVILELVQQQANRLRGTFVVVQPGRVRIVRTPGG
jgi:predicted nuclease of predicted toxin-antitoxin system